MESLQKESEWEEEDNKITELIESLPFEKQGEVWSCIYDARKKSIANREKEIAEEVKKIDINILDDEYIDAKTFRNKVLQLLKH